MLARRSCSSSSCCSATPSSSRARHRYLLAGMPSAFHLLVLDRVYEVRPAPMNRIVVGTTIPAVAAVVLVIGLAR